MYVFKHITYCICFDICIPLAEHRISGLINTQDVWESGRQPQSGSNSRSSFVWHCLVPRRQERAPGSSRLFTFLVDSWVLAGTCARLASACPENDHLYSCCKLVAGSRFCRTSWLGERAREECCVHVAGDFCLACLVVSPLVDAELMSEATSNLVESTLGNRIG